MYFVLSHFPVSQDVIGDIEMKTTSVHFYVQRNSEFYTVNGVLPFQLARLNEGDAFDLTSGTFTAPVPGIYHFQFSGLKHDSSPEMSFFLQVNGNKVGEAYTSAAGRYSGLSLSSSLQLEAKDKVTLCLKAGVLYDSNNGLTHFSGWLVEQYLK